MPPPAKLTKKTQPAPKQTTAGHSPPAPCGWIQELPPSCVFVQSGYPAVAPVVHHDAELQDLFSAANHILYDLAGDAANEVELNHDPEWSEYPEIGEAITALGFGEVSLCVAALPSRGIWAVGLASQQKKRIQSAKLSLCVALAANADSLSEIFAKHPEFVEMCSGAGINTDDLDFENPGQSDEWLTGGQPTPEAAFEDEDPLAATLEAEAAEEAAALEAAEAEAAALAAEEAAALDPDAEQESWAPKKKKAKVSQANQEWKEETALARDIPHWMCPVEVPPQLDSLSPEVLVVAADASAKKSLYSHADVAVKTVLGDLAGEVEYVDDPNWSEFPGIGSALKLLAEKEECFVVAISPSHSLYAVGVAMKGKVRYSAAKVALAAQVALQQVEIGEDLPDISECGPLADFIEEARAAKESFQLS